MYETFEHTADVGLRVIAPDLDTLFAEAGEALFSLIVEDLADVEAHEVVTIHIDGGDLPFLLFDWLNELLYRFDGEHRLFARFRAHVGPTGVDGEGWGETWDRERHALDHEVKAITYHGLRVEPTADGWLAEVIVDI
ncbi:MAG: archease [Anaerolineae bacterium]